MNQILSTTMPNEKKKKDKQPIETKSILKFFAIAILIFGILMIGTGVYALNESKQQSAIQNAEPTISLENKTDTTLLLKVTNQVNISQVEYYWNDQDETIIQGNDGKYVEAQIEIPAGENTLHVIVTDENNKITTYDKDYDIESNIGLEVDGDKINITYSGDTIISYMTYRWDEEEERTIQIDDTIIDQTIDVKKGLHTLTVVVVDVNNVTDTKVQKINGVAKPEVEVTLDSTLQHFLIKVNSDTEISRLEVTVDQDEEQQYVLNLEGMNASNFEYVVPMDLHDGENFIDVTVYTVDNVTGTNAVKYTKR